jgi:hypothetical protein
MFAYNPTVDDRSGEIKADGITSTAAINAAMMQQLGKDISKPIRTIGQAAAGFAMGGPAGAAMAAGGGGGGGADEGSVLGSFINAYANNKALEAKGTAYADFMKQHGEQLGFDPTYLQDFLKKKPREQAMIGDNIIGMQNTGTRLMGLNYMNQQANLYNAPRANPGGGMSGGGAAPQESVSF